MKIDKEVLHSKFLKIAQEFNAATDIRQKYKLDATLENLAFAAFKANQDDVARIEEYIKALQKLVRKKHPAYASKMISRKLELTGMILKKESIILSKKYFEMIHFGSLELGDPTLEVTSNSGNNDFIAERLAQIHSGERFFIDPDNGEYNINIRLIDFPEPVILVNDYKRLANLTPVATINLPSGVLGFASIDYLEDTKNVIKLPTGPGIYKIAAFLLQTESYDCTIIIVLCKSKDQVIDNSAITKIPELAII